MSAGHIPVLLEGVLEHLATLEEGLFVDVTIGGGGHAYEVLSRCRRISFVGMDADSEALEIAGTRLQPFADRVRLARGNFRDLKANLESLGIVAIDRILFDLGISMLQMKGGRGFSFHDEGSLDMRMDDRANLTASEVVNCYGYEDLRRVLAEYGEEERAHKIARAIVEARKKKDIETPKELANIVERAKPRRSRIHPATKTFQAIRMEVNGELMDIEKGIGEAIDLLKPLGRIGVISFHSLEDRIVKYMFRNSPALDVLT